MIKSMQPMMRALTGARVGVLLILVFIVAALSCAPEPLLPAPTSPPPAPEPAVKTGNRPPQITSLSYDQPELLPLGTTTVRCTAMDPDGDTISFSWTAAGGVFSGDDRNKTWMAPTTTGAYKITVTVSDGKGGTAKGSLTINVVSNRNPVIAGISIDPAVVAPGKTATLSVDAFDPDNNEIGIKWEVSTGTIVGSGKQVVWIAPNQGGDHLIRVTVTDSKGGASSTSTIVRVGSPEKSITINLVPNESGAVYSDGNVTPMLFVGDDKDNRGIRAFFSFNLAPLAGATVVSARLIFTVDKSIGPPFVTLGDLMLERVDYGAFPIQRSNFDTQASPLVKYGSNFPEQVDVTSQVAYAARAIQPRFQIRAAFERTTDTGWNDNYILFSNAIMVITYRE